MWATPSDLAQFATRVMQAYAGQTDEVLSHAMAIEMLTPQIASHGLGPGLQDDGDDRFHLLHWGGAETMGTSRSWWPIHNEGRGSSL